MSSRLNPAVMSFIQKKKEHLNRVASPESDWKYCKNLSTVKRNFSELDNKLLEMIIWMYI